MKFLLVVLFLISNSYGEKKVENVCIKIDKDTICGPKVEETEETSTMTVDKLRSALYPISGGYGYHSIGQVYQPISHYPHEYPQFTDQDNNMKSARSFIKDKSPKIYIIQTPPQVIEKPVYVKPWFRSDEHRTMTDRTEDHLQLHQLHPLHPQPSVHYSTQYLMERPTPHIIPPMSRLPMTLQCEIKPPGLERSSDERSAAQQLSHQELPYTFGYMELDNIKERTHNTRSADYAKQGITEGTYPNYEEQMRNAQIQYYYNELLRNAYEIEKRTKEANSSPRFAADLDRDVKIKESEERIKKLRHLLEGTQNETIKSSGSLSRPENAETTRAVFYQTDMEKGSFP